MWPCRSTLAGMTVLPVRSTRRAPGGNALWPRRRTRGWGVREEVFFDEEGGGLKWGGAVAGDQSCAFEYRHGRSSGLAEKEYGKTQRHKDTEAQRRTPRFPNARLCASVSLCLCVFHLR